MTKLIPAILAVSLLGGCGGSPNFMFETVSSDAQAARDYCAARGQEAVIRNGVGVWHKQGAGLGGFDNVPDCVGL